MGVEIGVLTILLGLFVYFHDIMLLGTYSALRPFDEGQSKKALNEQKCQIPWCGPNFKSTLQASRPDL